MTNGHGGEPNGTRAGAEDQAGEDPADAKGQKRPKQADVLINIASALLFHTADGVAYADIEVNGHRETWPIRSRSFELWLRCRFYERTGGAPNSEALATAIGMIESAAMFGGEERAVYMRVAANGNVLYVDLANNEWQAVEIDATGWRVITGTVSARGRNAGAPATGARWLDRCAAEIHQRQGQRLRVGAGGAARHRAVSGAGGVGRAGQREVNGLEGLTTPGRPQHGTAARAPARGPRSLYCRQERARAGVRQRLAAADLDLRHPLHRRRWIGRSVHSINRRDIIDLVERSAVDRPVMATRALAVLSIFNWYVSATSAVSGGRR
jgi:hypothetical protein